MQKILFKGKSIKDGKWVKGYCVVSDDKTFIGMDAVEHYCVPALRWFEVDPETISQFTGLVDENGKRIWENDVVIYEKQYAPVKFGLYRQSMYYYKNIYGFYVDFPEETLLRKDFGFWHKKVEVIGNIFDNPELLQRIGNERKD